MGGAALQAVSRGRQQAPPSLRLTGTCPPVFALSLTQALAAYGILSAPVSDAISGEYVGMLDVADIVRGVVQGALKLSSALLSA